MALKAHLITVCPLSVRSRLARLACHNAPRGFTSEAGWPPAVNRPSNHPVRQTHRTRAPLDRAEGCDWADARMPPTPNPFPPKPGRRSNDACMRNGARDRERPTMRWPRGWPAERRHDGATRTPPRSQACCCPCCCCCWPLVPPDIESIKLVSIDMEPPDFFVCVGWPPPLPGRLAC